MTVNKYDRLTRIIRNTYKRVTKIANESKNKQEQNFHFGQKAALGDLLKLISQICDASYEELQNFRAGENRIIQYPHDENYKTLQQKLELGAELLIEFDEGDLCDLMRGVALCSIEKLVDIKVAAEMAIEWYKDIENIEAI